MVIAVNIRSLPGSAVWNALMEETLLRLAARHPRLQVIFITDSTRVPVTPARNVQYHVVQRLSSAPLALAWWYNLQLPALLRRLQADVVLQCGGIASRRTRVPQCLLLQDVVSPEQPGWWPQRYQRFVRKNLPSFLQKAALILAPPNTCVSYAQQQLPGDTATVRAWQPVPAAVSRPDDDERELLKQQYAGGHEYFVCQAAVHPRSHLLLLLRAFSLFKKRMKSGMRLVIITTGALPAKDAWVESLRLYKYRSELQLVEAPAPAEAARILGAGYAAIQLSPVPSDIILSQACWAAAVPVITAEEETTRELMGDAALYTGMDDPAQLAAQLMAIYRDENLHKTLQTKGRSRWSEKVEADYDEQLYLLLRSLQQS